MSEIDWIVESYFSCPDQVIELEPGQLLLKTGEENGRLYYIVEGRLTGYEFDSKGARRNRLLLKEGDFVGVRSFFATSHEVAYDVVANKYCRLAYIEAGCRTVDDGRGRGFYEQFMPVLVADLNKRTHTAFGMAEAQNKQRDKQRETERLAALGDLSAGIAHELNNSFAVIAKAAAFYEQEMSASFEGLVKEVYFYALEKGRFVSSRDLRSVQRLLVDEMGVERARARRLAATGIEVGKLCSIAKLRDDELDEVLRGWEMGATLNDMALATEQSEHVLNSMRLLGVAKSQKRAGVDVNETIQTALTLVRAKTKHLRVVTDLHADSPLYVNAGELVQIWINLMKNSSEAIDEMGGGEWDIRVSSHSTARGCEVIVADAGPGISPSLLASIFKPSVTTKKKGLDFGLGLGLTIVNRLVFENGGEIRVSSREGLTEFRVFFDSQKIEHEIGESDV